MSSPRRRQPTAQRIPVSTDSRNTVSSNPRVTMRDQQRLLTRQKLIESAVQTFGGKGYAATTVDEIVTSAGASRATFYLHFPNKLAVLHAASAELAVWAPTTLAMLDGPELSRRRVKQVVTASFVHWRDHSQLLIAILEAEAVEPGHREQIRADLERAVDHAFSIRLGRLRGRSREVARTELLMLATLLYRYMAQQFAGDEQTDADLAVPIEALTNVTWAVLSSRPVRDS